MYTLIMNYFVERKMITEIKEYVSVEAAMKRVEELRNVGIELSEWHFGIYEILHNQVIEVTPKKKPA